MRIILFTGKGGVGKSTNACATAALTAATGRKTLLVSSDLAHNLSDIFDVKDGSSKKRISGNLDILEVDIMEEIRKNWDSVQRYFIDLFSYFGMDSVVAEEVALIPGIDALFLLTGILREIESKTYDVVIIDCAPTAGTLRLLTLADTSINKVNRLIKIERNIFKLVRPIGKRMKSVKYFLPEDELYITFGKMIDDIGRLGIILRNHEVCSIRLVLNPDKIAIAESKRSYTYFSLFGFPVDAVLVNKLFPVELEDGYFHKWRHLQQEQMKLLHRSFLDTRIIPIRHYENEPIGLERLEEMGKDIYGELDPAAVLSIVNFVTFKKQNGRVVLSIVLPGLDKTSIDVGRKYNDLLISAEGYSRVFSLPDTLANVDIDKAEYDENRLNIRFARKV
jgi:arsenite/tail-anchored protein-transporting ATPase